MELCGSWRPSKAGVPNPWATDRFLSVACSEMGYTAGKQSLSVLAAAPQH